MRGPAAGARLDIDWLTEGLAIGGSFPGEAAAALAGEHGISHVVDLRAEACDGEALLRRHGILFLHLPTPDNCAVAPQMLRDGVAWVGAALDGGGRALIHCQHGIGRSALLALAVLVSQGVPPLQALERAKAVRRIVSPSPEQLRAFIAFARALRDAGAGAGAGVGEGAGLGWAVPTFDALAAVAYRHLRDVEGGAARTAPAR
jgi:predicted protein tyrosine phosphatase